MSSVNSPLKTLTPTTAATGNHSNNSQLSSDKVGNVAQPVLQGLANEPEVKKTLSMQPNPQDKAQEAPIKKELWKITEKFYFQLGSKGICKCPTMDKLEALFKILKAIPSADLNLYLIELKPGYYESLLHCLAQLSIPENTNAIPEKAYHDLRKEIMKYIVQVRPILITSSVIAFEDDIDMKKFLQADLEKQLKELNGKPRIMMPEMLEETRRLVKHYQKEGWKADFFDKHFKNSPRIHLKFEDRVKYLAETEKEMERELMYKVCAHGNSLNAHGASRTYSVSILFEIMIYGFVGSQWAGPLAYGDGNRSIFAGPHGPFYVLFGEDLTRIHQANHIAYLVPYEKDREQLKINFQHAVSLEFITETQRVKLVEKIMTYEEFLKLPKEVVESSAALESYLQKTRKA